MTTRLTLATKEQLAIAQAKALKNNTSGLAFVCTTLDSDVLQEIRQLVGDYNISAAQFETYTGDYTNIFVRYGYPSNRHSDNDWYKVTFNDNFRFKVNRLLLHNRYSLSLDKSINVQITPKDFDLKADKKA